MLRPAYQDVRFCYKTKEKKEDRKIVWNQADYKVQLKKIWRIFGKSYAEY